MGRTSDLCKSSLLCGFRVRAIAMRSLQAVNRAEPMGWRLGIVPPSMLWEMLAWAELEPTQMKTEPGRDDLWVFCPHGRSTVVTAEPKSKTPCYTLTVSHSLLRTHWLELSLTTQGQLLDVSYFANESSHSRNMCILQLSSESITTGVHYLEDKSMHFFNDSDFSCVQTYIVPSNVYTFVKTFNMLGILSCFRQSIWRDQEAPLTHFSSYLRHWWIFACHWHL